MTRKVAGLEEGEWDAGSQALVVETFDALASSWHTRISPETMAVVEDAMTRGLDRLLARNGLAVEVGSGIGSYSPLLAGRFETVVSVELSWQMLSRAGPVTLRVQGDGARLPIRDQSVDAVALINAFLFPAEVDRVLRPGGALLWVNSSGEATPIHLSSGEVESALPFRVRGVESRAGAGTWCAVVRRG